MTTLINKTKRMRLIISPATLVLIQNLGTARLQVATHDFEKG